MNILVTSAGRRVKLIEYFKETLKKFNGKVIATDCNTHAPAIYFADMYEIVPRIDDPNYIDKIIEICTKYDVKALVSLIDPELELLASNKSKFDEMNITLILSPLDQVEIAFDKLKTFRYLTELDIPTVPTYDDLKEVEALLHAGNVSFPLVVKPAKGSASLGLYIVNNKTELREAFYKMENQIIQPFYKEKEYGIDVYIDMKTGVLIDLFIKEKKQMRAGETDKSLSIHNNKIEELINNLINKTNFKGPVDVDVFEYKGNYYGI